jgi:hypothetical protein
MIGPLLISQTKTAESYNYFFWKACCLLRIVLAFGTDGEDPLIEGMRNTMRHAIHLRCFGHFRDNCKMKLRQSNVPDVVQQSLLEDIFWQKTWKKGNKLITNTLALSSVTPVLGKHVLPYSHPRKK